MRRYCRDTADTLGLFNISAGNLCTYRATIKREPVIIDLPVVYIYIYSFADFAHDGYRQPGLVNFTSEQGRTASESAFLLPRGIEF